MFINYDSFQFISNRFCSEVQDVIIQKLTSQTLKGASFAYVHHTDLSLEKAISQWLIRLII